MTTGHSNVSASALDAAYRATTYAADYPHGRISIRIDQPCPDLDRLLQQTGCRQWAFVSAANPGSRPLADSENQQRHLQLQTMVKARGLTCYLGVGIPDASDWQPEASLLILGIAVQDALQLAAEFGQTAIVTGAEGEAARLRYVHGNSTG